jgi:hypothetical protein
MHHVVGFLHDGDCRGKLGRDLHEFLSDRLHAGAVQFRGSPHAFTNAITYAVATCRVPQPRPSALRMYSSAGTAPSALFFELSTPRRRAGRSTTRQRSPTS